MQEQKSQDNNNKPKVINMFSSFSSSSDLINTTI